MKNMRIDWNKQEIIDFISMKSAVDIHAKRILQLCLTMRELDHISIDDLVKWEFREFNTIIYADFGDNALFIPAEYLWSHLNYIITLESKFHIENKALIEREQKVEQYYKLKEELGL